MARPTSVIIGACACVAMLLAPPAPLCAQESPKSAPATPPGDSATLFAEGRRLLDAGQCARAVAVLSDAVAARPDECRFALKLAEAYACSGKPEAATRLLVNLHAARPDVLEVAVALAAAHVREAGFAKAIEVLSPNEARLDPDGLLLLIQALDRSGQPARAAVAARDGLRRFPQNEALWLARVDQALAQGRAALALRTIDEARQAIADSGQLSLRAAQAYLMLGQAMGAAEVRKIPGGQVGHVRDGWLLIDVRKQEDSFLCCPRASALYEIRRAVDAGLDDPEVHCLHARVWQQAGMPQRGFKLLKDHEPTLLEAPDAATVRTYLDVALAAGELNQAARYASRAAQVEPQRRDEILHDAYVQIAEAYNQRGNEPLYVEFLNRAIDLKPDDVRLSMRLAEAEWAADRCAAAVRIYERLLRDHPNLAGDQTILQRLAETRPSPTARP